MSGAPGISIVIVNWNTRDFLVSCLASIDDVVPREERQIIVVDNGSRDGSSQTVRERFPDALLVANSSNRGFAGGVNEGLRLAREKFILILNPDIILRRGVVEGLSRYLDGHPDCAAVMPLLRNQDGSVQKGYVRRTPSLTQVLLFATVLQPWASRKPHLVSRYLEAPQASGDVIEVEQIPGAFLMTTREVLDKVGPFDEAFRLFFEDVEWSSRAREKGLKLVMLSCHEVTHIGGRSFVTDDGNWIQARYFVSLVTYFARRKQTLKALLAAKILIINALLVLVKNSLFRGRSNSESRRRAALSRRTYGNVLRLFYRAFVLRRDESVLP